MEETPEMNESGYNSPSSPSVKRILRFPSCESTPSTSRPRPRKRKSEHFKIKSRKLYEILEDRREQVSPCSTNRYHSSFSESFDLSKSTNEFSPIADVSFLRDISSEIKLSSSLEKCTLDDLANESPHAAKKYKWDDEEIFCDRKANSAPGTPQRQEKVSDHSLRKFYSLDLTPTKGTSVKIGTPERLEILYPTLVPVKSPSKIRNEFKRLNKPAKKRLFQCRDFVFLFTSAKKVDHVIENIFSYLGDTDLVNVAKVSKNWRKALRNDQHAFNRYKEHLRSVTVSKENIYVSSPETNSSALFSAKMPFANFSCGARGIRSPPRSPSRENWTKFTRVAATLSGTQRLTKCMVCKRPAVQERKLARCSGPNCGYLWCVACGNGSQSPDDLECRCDRPQSPRSPPLVDRSNIDISAPSDASLYFLDRSSGYYSFSDADKSLSFCDKPRVLTDCNDNFTQRRKLQLHVDSSSNNNNNNNTQEHSAVIRKAKKTLSTKKKLLEPGSPQKIKMYAAGSVQSKKNLRRL